MDITVHNIEPFRARDVSGAIARIFRDAYSVTDDEALSFVGSTFAKHTRWPEFRLLVAAIESIPVGFVYGYRSQPGQWWYDTVAADLRAAGYGEWLDDACELAEVAVDPAFHRRGIGRELIEAFIDAHSCRHLLLSVDEGSAAQPLYASFGFRTLLAGYQYPGFEERVAIMGRTVA